MPKPTFGFQNRPELTGSCPSTTTTAMATSRPCVRLSDVRVTPMAIASSAARPLQCSVGLCPGSLRTSISLQLTPRLIPVPRAFAPASFAANLAAKLSADCLFFRKQYSISPGVNTRVRNRSPNRSTLACTRPISIRSVPSPNTICGASLPFSPLGFCPPVLSPEPTSCHALTSRHVTTVPQLRPHVLARSSDRSTIWIHHHHRSDRSSP